MSVFGAALSMPLWRLALTAVLIMAFAIAAADVSPASASSKVYPVPSGIDATGKRDVSRELNSFIRSVPNGSTIVFKAGGTYRLGGVLRVSGKTGITLKGNGAKLELKGAGNYFGAGIYVERGSKNTIIRNLNIVGNHEAAGTSKACCRREGQHGIGVHGSSNTLIKRVNIRRIGGDCFNIATWYNQRAVADGVTVRDSTCRLSGRMGVTINGGKNVRIVNNVFREVGYAVVGMEPNRSYQGSSGVVIRGNKIGSYSLTDNYKGALYYACDARWIDGPSTIRDVTVTGNTVAGNRSGKDGSIMGLNIVVCRSVRAQNFTITNNTARQAVVGPVMRFDDVQGVTVTGNKQPLRSGSLASIQRSSAVTYRP
jgi:hypothetical protein